MANILKQFCVVLFIVHSVTCQDIVGHNPFSGKTANTGMSNENIMQEIFAKLQHFEKKNIDQDNMMNQFHQENINLQGCVKQLENEKVNLQNGMKQLQEDNVNLQNGMKQLQEDNVNLQNGMKQLQEDNVNLHDGMKQLQEDNVNLQDGMKLLQIKNVNLENRVNQVQTENVKLEDGLENENINMKRLQKENVKQCTDLKKKHADQIHLDEDLKHIKGQINLQQNLLDMKMENLKFVESLEKIEEHLEKQNTFVSFTAYATDIHEYNADDVIQSDGIVVNYGGFYDNSTSIFTCPYSGYYTFTVSVLAASTYKMVAQINLDGTTTVVSAYANDVDTLGQASSTATVKCDSGQQVWVRCRDNGDRMHGGGYKHSSFTGTLLRVI